MTNVAIIVARRTVAIDLIVMVVHRNRRCLPSPGAPSPSLSSLSRRPRRRRRRRPSPS